jgi:hypothetical protein
MAKKADAHKPPIALWEQTEDSEFVSADGKLFICHFDKVFDVEDVNSIGRFMIDKTSYQKQLPQIVKYTNYFINKYDVENELMMSYFRIKCLLDKNNEFMLPPMPPESDINARLRYEKERNQVVDAFSEFVIGELFSEDSHIADNIWQMTEDNYFDNIERDNDRVKKSPDKEYLESLEFTNLHIKTLLAISCAIKMMSPIVFHFFYLRTIKLEKDTDLIFRFYKPLFTIFDHGANLYNKIYVYVKSRVLESNSINGPIFEKMLVFGLDKIIVINNFVKKVIISENMVKYLFPENWSEKTGGYEENIVG